MRGQRRPFVYIVLISVIVLVAVAAYRSFPNGSQQDRDLGQFQLALQNAQSCSSNQSSCKDPDNTISTQTDKNHEAVIDGDGQGVTWYTVNGKKVHSTAPGNSDIPSFFSKYAFTNYKAESGGSNLLLSILLPNLILLLIIGGFMWYMLRQTQSGSNQALSFGRSRARMLTGDKPAITFNDVAGVEEAKVELGEIVEFLKYPDKFTAVGARIPKGVLLVGPRARARRC